MFLSWQTEGESLKVINLDSLDSLIMYELFAPTSASNMKCFWNSGVSESCFFHFPFPHLLSYSHGVSIWPYTSSYVWYHVFQLKFCSCLPLLTSTPQTPHQYFWRVNTPAQKLIQVCLTGAKVVNHHHNWRWALRHEAARHRPLPSWKKSREKRKKPRLFKIQSVMCVAYAFHLYDIFWLLMLV